MAYTLNYSGNTLPKDITQQLINYAEKDLKVPPSYLITKLHYEGLWGGSEVARQNNNWGGMTWGDWREPYTRPSGVVVTRGSARPANEGGYYIKYKSVQDFLIDWSYLIRRGGIYNVADSKTFNEAVKGMFIYGGADADYATMNVEGSKLRYELYLEGMLARRTGINNANSKLLDKLDSESHADGGGTTPPDPDPEPDPDPDPKPELPDFQKLLKNVGITLKSLLTVDLYKNGISDMYTNDFIKLTNQLNNSFKIQPTEKLFDSINKVFDNFLESVPLPNPDPDPDPDPKPDPTPDNKPARPVSKNNVITSLYGYRTDPYEGFHAGLDFGAVRAGVDGDPIYAVMDGKVEVAGFNDGGLGNVVWINHSKDNYYSAYAHLSRYNTSVGKTVKKGDVIGYMGNTGWSTGTHLHIVIATQLWGNKPETTIDPKPYLGV